MTPKERQEAKRTRKRVSDRNYRFRKKTPEGKRIEIAKDVLAMLAKSKIQVKAANGYILFGEGTDGVTPQMDGALKVHDLLGQADRGELPVSCTVCALGACFKALVDRVDGVTVGAMQAGAGLVGRDQPRYQINTSKLIKGKLAEYFDMKQVEMIEAAFEQTGMHSSETPEAALYSSRIFEPDLYDPRERLEAIMENIIVNGGTFVP